MAIAAIALSDGSYDGFVGLAMSAIIDAQIKTGALRFDTGQYQRPAALEQGGRRLSTNLKSRGSITVRISQRLCGRNSESISQSKQVTAKFELGSKQASTGIRVPCAWNRVGFGDLSQRAVLRGRHNLRRLIGLSGWGRCFGALQQQL
jgi:hypothetical protein